MKGLTLTVAARGFLAKRINKAEYGSGRGRKGLCCGGIGGVSRGGASSYGNGVVDGSVLGGEEG